MKILFFIILTIAIIFVIYVRYLEETTVFVPSREIYQTPKDINLAFEDIYFATEDHLRLNGWLIKNPQAASTMIFLHGNAGNISDRLEKVTLFYNMGMNIFIVDYRGYGKSEGRPTEKGVYKDAVAAFDYLKTRSDIDKGKIVAYGASLGGAIAVDLASKRPLKAVIIDSTFNSAVGMAKHIYPFVPSFLVKAKFDSEHKIKSVFIPKLFIHSMDDDMIPLELSVKLFNASPEPKQFLKIHGTHNDGFIFDRHLYEDGIKQFLTTYGVAAP